MCTLYLFYWQLYILSFNPYMMEKWVNRGFQLAVCTIDNQINSYDYLFPLSLQGCCIRCHQVLLHGGCEEDQQDPKAGHISPNARKNKITLLRFRRPLIQSRKNFLCCYDLGGVRRPCIFWKYCKFVQLCSYYQTNKNLNEYMAKIVSYFSLYASLMWNVRETICIMKD